MAKKNLLELKNHIDNLKLQIHQISLQINDIIR
jgi:hypothetical protein